MRRQGAHRRLPDAWRRRCARREVAPGHLRATRRCWRTARRSWATRWPARSANASHRSCCGPATGAADVAQDRGRAAGRPGAAARRGPASPTCGCSARSASCSSTRRSTCRAATAAAVGAGRVAAPVPRPDLHDAAVRHRRRRRGLHHVGSRRASRPRAVTTASGEPMETFGARLHRRHRRAGAAVRRHRPARGAAGPLGPAGRRRTACDRFSRTVVEALGRPGRGGQAAVGIFRAFGSRGVAVLESTIRQLREAGALVLLDVKRGDIGSTVARVRRRVPGSSQPAVCRRDHREPVPRASARCARCSTTAAAHGGGVFVLALTSNPEGPPVQRAVGPTAGPSRRPSSTRFPSSTWVRSRSAASGWWSARRSATPATTCPRSTARCSRRASARRAAGRRPAYGLRREPAAVLPSYSREVLAAGPTWPRLRAAADRVLDRLPGGAGAGD